MAAHRGVQNNNNTRYFVKQSMSYFHCCLDNTSLFYTQLHHTITVNSTFNFSRWIEVYVKSSSSHEWAITFLENPYYERKIASTHIISVQRLIHNLSLMHMYVHRKRKAHAKPGQYEMEWLQCVVLHYEFCCVILRYGTIVYVSFIFNDWLLYVSKSYKQKLIALIQALKCKHFNFLAPMVSFTCLSFLAYSF